jgi:hypothetical protein
MFTGLGKRVGDELYLHNTALAVYPDEALRSLAQSAFEAIPPSIHPKPNVFKSQPAPRARVLVGLS